jgi:hypothetical protein
MTRDEWLTLAARCEAATGPNFQLELEINAAVLPNWALPGSAITASITAITALIELELPDLDGIIPLKAGGEAWLWPSRGPYKGWRVTAATPALSTCAAFCRAMAEKAG